MDISLDVPYRCPRCGGSRTFSTLAELRSHMVEDHAYSAQRRQRLKIFDYRTPPATDSHTGRHSPLLQSFLDEGKRLEEEVKAAKKQEFSNKLKRQKQGASPSKEFLSGAEGHANSLRAHGSPTRRKLKVNFRTPAPPQDDPHDSYLEETVSSLSNEVIAQRHKSWRTADALYSTQDVLSGMEEAAEGRVSEQSSLINRLTQELADKERQIQSLRLELQRLKEQDESSVTTVSESASVHSQSQIKKERQKLEDELVWKKSELESINRQLTKAQQQSEGQRVQRKNSSRKQKQKEKEDSIDHDTSSGHVRESQIADISSLNIEEDVGSEISTSQGSVTLSHSIGSSKKDRSNTLKKLKQNLVNHQSDMSSEFSAPSHQQGSRHSKSASRSASLRGDSWAEAQRLREEKQALSEQMKELLTKATTENEKLKHELIAKDSQLEILNQQLEKTKNDQTELMEETFDLYKEAEKSLGKLKELLKVKEAQLEQANSRMEEIREEQEKLEAERQSITQRVSQKDSMYHNMLKEKDEQIQHLNQTLASHQEEHDKLTEMASVLKKEVQEKEKAQQDLSKAIADKEQELAKAKEDVAALSTFLQTAAAKESVARGKLEAFVTELIDRADRAERELRVLQGLESSSSGNLTSDVSQAHSFPRNLSSIPDETGYTSMPPHSSARHSTPLKSRGHAAQADARHLLQTSLEPWYNNLSTTGVPAKPARTGLLQAGGPPPLSQGLADTGDTAVNAQYSYPAHCPPQPQLYPQQQQMNEVEMMHLQNGVLHSNSAGPRLYPYQESQPFPISESSEEFAPLPPRNQAGAQQRADGSCTRPAYNNSGNAHPALYASPVSPQRIRAAGNTNQNSLPWRQEFAYTDSSASYPPFAPHPPRQRGDPRVSQGAEVHSHCAAHNGNEPLPLGVKPMPSSHKKKKHVPTENEGPQKHMLDSTGSKGVLYQDSFDSTDTLDGKKAISPDRTYTILSVTGEEARGLYLEGNSPQSGDSDNSSSTTPTNKIPSNRRGRLKGKTRPYAAPLQKRAAGMMQTPDESSTDGLELSIDDNGIMWEPANSFSDIDESYRMSPYGSETAGDVDSSVLLSSHSLSNQGLQKAQDTDEDLEVYDGADFLQATSLSDNFDSKRDAKTVGDKKTSQVPLGERISRILNKCVDADDDHSEKQDLRGMANSPCSPRVSSAQVSGGHSGTAWEKGQKGRNTAEVTSLHPKYDKNKDEKPERDSPLARALAVQDRVKSLTFPREKKKSVTISDTSTSELADKPDDQRATRPVRKPRRKTESFRNSRNKRVEFEPMEDLSSSSYASMGVPDPVRRAHSPTPIPQLPEKATGGTSAELMSMLKHGQENTEKQSLQSKPVPAQRSRSGKVSEVGNGIEANKGAGLENPDDKQSKQKLSSTGVAHASADTGHVTNTVPALSQYSSVKLSAVQNLGNSVSLGSEKDRNEVQKEEWAMGRQDNTLTPLPPKPSENKELQTVSKSLPNSQHDPSKKLADKGTSELPTKSVGVTQHTEKDGLKSASKQAITSAANLEGREHTSIKKSPKAFDVSASEQEISVTTDESSDLKKYKTAALVPAKQLRARFSQASHSSLQSSTESLSPPQAVSPPLPRPSSPLPPSPSLAPGERQVEVRRNSSPRPASPQDKGSQDSTDFDLDSDLEKLAAPGSGGTLGGLRKGLATGKPGRKKALHKKTHMRKSMAPGKTSQPGALDVTDESSAAHSDGDAPAKRLREERRRRRVALFHIFSYLDTQTLGKMALVCKEWRRVSRHPALWTNVHLKYDRISSQYLVTISQWCTKLTSLTLEGLRPGSRKTDETMDEYHRRTKGCLEPGLEELLKTSQDSLTSLSIIACGNILTEKCMWLVSGYCRLLQRLTYISDTHPLTAEVMWALGGGCPSITSLFIPPLFPCTNREAMTNRCLLLLAQFYPDLQEVGVGGRALDITGLAPLVQSCQRLHILSLDHVKEMGDDSATALCRAGLRQLQKLEICGTPLTANAIKTFYSSCRHLKEIRVVLSIGDIFDDSRKKKNKEQYKKVVHSLEELKSQPGLGNVLQLQVAPVD